MILRTIIFFLLLYILIKVLSRFFLPSNDQTKNRSGSGFFYTHHKQSDRNSRNRNQDSVKSRLDQIEEAEYEEITDEEKEEKNPKHE